MRITDQERIHQFYHLHFSQKPRLSEPKLPILERKLQAVILALFIHQEAQENEALISNLLNELTIVQKTYFSLRLQAIAVETPLPKVPQLSLRELSYLVVMKHVSLTTLSQYLLLRQTLAHQQKVVQFGSGFVHDAERQLYQVQSSQLLSAWGWLRSRNLLP